MLIVVMNWLVQNTVNVTPAKIQEYADHVRASFPNAKMTWSMMHTVFSGTKTLEIAEVKNQVDTYGDEVGIGYGFPNRDYIRATYLEFINNAIAGVQNNFAVSPKSFACWGINIPQLQILKDKGFTTAMVSAWSQSRVDGYSAFGGMPYPWWVGKKHHLVPAQDDADRMGILCLDTNTPDLEVNQHHSTRFTVHPADPIKWGSANAEHITQQFLNNEAKNGFTLINQYPEVNWLASNLSIENNWKNYITWLGQNHPDAVFMTMQEFNAWFQSQFGTEQPDYALAYTGSGFDQTTVLENVVSDSNLTNYWWFGKEGRVCVQKNIALNTYTMIDCVRYRGNGIKEPKEVDKNFSYHTFNASVKSGLSWKYDDPKQGFHWASIKEAKKWERIWPELPKIL